MEKRQMEDIVWVYGLIAMLAHNKIDPNADQKQTADAFDELYDYVWNNRAMLGNGFKGISGNFGIGDSGGHKLTIEIEIKLG